MKQRRTRLEAVQNRTEWRAVVRAKRRTLATEEKRR
jgi:hypothetical protein